MTPVNFTQALYDSVIAEWAAADTDCGLFDYLDEKYRIVPYRFKNDPNQYDIGFAALDTELLLIFLLKHY